MNVRYLLGRALSPSASLEFDAQTDRTLPADVLIALGWVNRTCPDNPGLASLMLRVKWGRIFAELPMLYREIHNLAFLAFCQKRWMTGPEVQKQPITLTAEALHMHLVNSRIYGQTAYHLAREDGWLHRRSIKPAVMDAFVMQLLVEWFDDVCTTCNGRGEIVDRFGKHKCPECNGSTHAHVSDRQRAEACGMHLATYQRQDWERRFQVCGQLLSDLEGRACGRMKYHLIG